VLYGVSNHKQPLDIAKLKIGDSPRLKGSPGGFRCIVLTDDDLGFASFCIFLIKTEKETHSATEDNQLIKLPAT